MNAILIVDLSKMELSDLIKSSSLVTESTLNPSQEKTIAGATSEPIIDEDSENYEDWTTAYWLL